MTEYEYAEWKKEIEKRFGDNILDWKFKCPACGKITSGAEMKEIGAKANDLPQKCIGNFKGQGEPDPENNKNGCNWKAYGLFQIGNTVIKDGKEISVFPLADMEV